MFYEFSRSKGHRYISSDIITDLKFDTHLHSCFEFLYIISGSIVCTLNNVEYTVDKGKVIFIQPNQIHSFFTPVQSLCKTLIFSSDYVNSFASELRNKHLCNPVFEFDRPDILSNIDFDNYFMCKSQLYYICSYAYRLCELREIKKSSETLTQKIVIYIQENYANDITITDISKELGYNSTYLSTVINTHFNMSFKTLVNMYRIDTATILLKSSDISITEIASKSGFNTIRNFNRVFKSVNGKSPTDYRNFSSIISARQMQASAIDNISM